MNQSHRQSQFELFPGSSDKNKDASKRRNLFKDLTVSLENVIVLCIVLVIVLVVFFSFGVEKGRQVNPQSLASEQVADQEVFVAEALAPGISEVPEGLTAERLDLTDIAPQVALQEAVSASEVALEEVPIVVPAVPILEGYTVQVASFKRKNTRGKSLKI